MTSLPDRITRVPTVRGAHVFVLGLQLSEVNLFLTVPPISGRLAFFLVPKAAFPGVIPVLTAS